MYNNVKLLAIRDLPNLVLLRVVGMGNGEMLGW